jgi:hypothetical protein
VYQVERAFKQWSTGQFEPDSATFSSLEWASQTQDLLQSIKKLKDSTWRRIMSKAEEYVGTYKKLGAYGPNYVNRMLAGHSGRAKVVDDSDDESPAAASDD